MHIHLHTQLMSALIGCACLLVASTTTAWAQMLVAHNDTIFLDSQAVQNQEMVLLDIITNDQFDLGDFDEVYIVVDSIPNGFLFYESCYCDVTYANINLLTGAFADQFTYRLQGITNGNYYYSPPATVLLLEACNDNACVYPGDTDCNGVVDLSDLLAIGLANGTTGPARGYPLNAADSGLLWLPYPAQPWTDEATGNVLDFGNTLNYHYADCDGNGVVNATDTTFVRANLGKNHSQIVTAYAPPPAATPYTLSISIQNPSVSIGDTVIADLMLGDLPIEVYGLAFTIEHNVVDSASMQVQFPPSFFNDDQQLMSMQQAYAGGMQGVVTRTDLQTRTGQGKVGTVSFIMEDVLEGKNADQALYINLRNVVLVGGGNTYLSLPDAQLQGDNVQFTGIEPQPAPYLPYTLYPNPAADYCTLSWISPAYQPQQISLYDSAGKMVQHLLPTLTHSQQLPLDLRLLPHGIYTLQIQTQQGLQTSTQLLK